ADRAGHEVVAGAGGRALQHVVQEVLVALVELLGGPPARAVRRDGGGPEDPAAGVREEVLARVGRGVHPVGGHACLGERERRRRGRRPGLGRGGERRDGRDGGGRGARG